MANLITAMRPGTSKHLAFMTAIYRIALRHHSGQWSRGYRLMCYTKTRVARYHSALDIGRVCEGLDYHSPSVNIFGRKAMKYPKHCQFRKDVAYYMMKIRHWRSRM
jgi:hypothetical protein